MWIVPNCGWDQARLGPAGRDPCTDADTLARAVETGLLDAPHLRGNAAACGQIVTRMVGGACLGFKELPSNQPAWFLAALVLAGVNVTCLTYLVTRLRAVEIVR